MDAKQWDKTATQYYDEVLSPFHKDVNNPLFSDLKKIKNKNKKSVAEFGCGLFELGKTLSKQFKSVHASDFSSEMVKKAKEKNKQSNVTIKKEDLRKLPHKNSFDVVIVVNAILMPSLKDIQKSLSNIKKSLKPKGTCFFQFPSMEAILYHNLLHLYSEIQTKKETQAIRRAKKTAEDSKYDYFLGYYKDGKEVQKFFYEAELRYLLKKTGFSTIQIKKVEYPWGDASGDYQDFPKEDPIWDWFVIAT